MSVVSFSYLLFFPLVIAGYYILPAKCRGIWLLLASYIFYFLASPIYGLLLLAVTACTYFLARRIESSTRDASNSSKPLLILGVAACLLLLGIFKYAQFVCSSATGILGLLGREVETPVLQIVMPLGISFYLFEAIGYLIDVYRGGRAEHSFLHYALFLSFFPNVASGPIERAEHFTAQLREKRGSLEDVRVGALRMLWGYLLKLVVADRIGVVVDTIYGGAGSYGGTILFVCVVLYSLQIYCDFAGYSAIAIGSARVMGFELLENFDSPYLSESVAEFWRRWHISLSTWFRDYMYFPLGGNRKGTARKYVNLLIVFLLSGLWHGAAWTFVFWGLLHGLYQVIGYVLRPVRDGLVRILHIDRTAFSHRLLKAAVTFLLVSIAWIFFRAPDFGTAFYVAVHMWQPTLWNLTDGSLYQLGLDRPNFLLMVACLVLVLAADILHRRGADVSGWVLRQSTWLRWAIVILGIVFVLVCGLWGSAYEGGSFIYNQF